MMLFGSKVSWRVNLGLVSLTVLLLSNVGHAAPPTAITTCGFEITTPGQYYLANDLLGCGIHGPNPLAVGIDIQASHVELRLNGHTISLGPSNSAGIFAKDQTDILIQGPGTIGAETGLVFSNVAFSRVMQVTAAGEVGFSVFSGSNNVFQGNEITVGEFDRIGIQIIASSENKVINNLVTNHGLIFPAIGIFLLGGADLNEVHANIVTGTGVTGTGPGTTGIFVLLLATQNDIAGNTVVGNGLDMRDGNPDCDENQWRGNQFDTANQECIQ